MKIKQMKGFTLTELLIVVVILGLLMGVALPSYRDYSERTRRTDAKSALLEIAAAQERAYFENRQYTGAIANVWSHKDGTAYVSPEGYYTLTVGLKSSDVTTFTATATARGKQTGDVDCQTLSIDETGLKSATAGTGGDSSVCW